MKKSPEYQNWEMHNFRELLDGIEARYPENLAFTWRCADTETGVTEKTVAEYADDVRNLATYLCAMGLEGKPVAVTGKNSYLWSVSYMAVGCGCGLIVPLDKDLRADELSDLLQDACCAAVLYSEDMSEKLDAIEISGLMKLPLSGIDAYLTQGRTLREAGSLAYENHAVDSDAPGVLLYTSGTMGVAKGVLLSQNNICSDIVNVCKKFKITSDDRVLSHLPLHHTYECMTELAILYHGASIAFNDSMRRMPGDLTLFRPTILITVPAVLEFMSRFVKKGYAEAKGGKILLGVQKAATGVVSGTVGLVSRASAEKSRRGIFSTVHKFMGGRLRAILVGAAALSPEIFRQFEQFGYAVYIGYGLTETSPISLMHDDVYRNPEDTGFPVWGVDVRIDEPDENGVGELCVRGPNVMLGYYNNEEATAEVLRDGWFHTGDLAMQTPTGAYRITGRMKSMIVSPTGKKIFPEELEAYFMKNPLVAECLVYAEEKNEGQTLCVAVYPDKAELIKLLELDPDTDLAALSEEDTARAKTLLLDIVRSVNTAFPAYKHIRKLVIRKTEFLKTTTRKITRNAPENASDAE